MREEDDSFEGAFDEDDIQVAPSMPQYPNMSPSVPPELETFVARRHEPPDALPMKGQLPDNELSLFGKTNYTRGYSPMRYLFGIKRKDRRRHLYVIGKSGVGKTKLLEQL